MALSLETGNSLASAPSNTKRSWLQFVPGRMNARCPETNFDDGQVLWS